jgi:hypothetical protein
VAQVNQLKEWDYFPRIRWLSLILCESSGIRKVLSVMKWLHADSSRSRSCFGYSRITQNEGEPISGVSRIFRAQRYRDTDLTWLGKLEESLSGDFEHISKTNRAHCTPEQTSRHPIGIAEHGR